MKLFACAWVGGGISGAILGGLGAKLYALAGDGLFRIPGMINPAGLDISFYGFIACANQGEQPTARMLQRADLQGLG